ncbi:MAG: hypothetical protein OXI83_01765 [Gemmatimonadota bacterium]|nr:hypothetical protein [Gemmatimonadota bacterium]
MISLDERMRRDARRTILEALHEDRTYTLNHAILRDLVDRLTAITLTESELKAHLAWLEDRKAVTLRTVPPFTIARLTDFGLALARGVETLEGVSRPRPDRS